MQTSVYGNLIHRFVDTNFEIIQYLSGSIIDLRNRKERRNKTAKLRAQRSGSQFKRKKKPA